MRRAPARLRLLACATAWAALGAGPAFAQPDARAALAEQAIHWQSLGRLELAEASWRKLLSADPQSADALYGMAQVELARGRPQAAQEWVARLRAAQPGDARADRLEARLRQPGGAATITDLQAARAAARAGRTDEALQAYRALFGNRAPPEPLALEYYQLLAGTPQGWEESRRGLEQLSRARPDRQDVRLALAQLQTYRDATRREGIRSLAGLARQPGGSAAREAWRQALLWLDARPADAALYRDYLALQPDPAIAQRLEGLGTARPQGDRPAAPDPLRLGFAAFERGDLAAAERRFRDALRQRPANADALGGLGLVRLRQQQFAQAESLLTQASRAGNGRRWASALRSASYWKLVGQASEARERGDLDQARPLLERAIELDPAEPAARDALAGLADLRAAQARAQAGRQADAGDLAGARRTLEAVLAEGPGSPWIRYELARLYRRMGLDAEARALMEAMPAAQRGTPDALQVQALLAADAGDAAAGVAYLDRIPDASRTPELLALRRDLQAAADAQRADRERVRAELEARQAAARRAEAERAPQLAAGTVYRHRRGEAGLGRLGDVQTPIEARLPLGQGRIVLGATPTELHAGTLAPDAAGRFGGGAPAAQWQAAGLVPPPGEQRAHGVGLHVGYEDAQLSASLGSTPLGFEHSSIVGHLAYSGRLGDTGSFKAELSRRPVTDSLLSFAGTRDPRTGLRWGGVVASGGRLDLAQDFGSWGVYGRGAVHSITGLNVEDNRRLALGGGVYLPVSRGPDGGLTVGMDLGLMSYDKNLGGFLYGQGGYFSPQRYAGLTFPLDWQGRDGRWRWRLNASIGVQSFREDPAPFSPLAGAASFAAATRHTGLAYNLAAVLEYRVAPQLYLGGALGFNNARDYRQFMGHAYLRYVFGGGAAAEAPSAPRLLGSPYTPLFP